MIEKHSHTWVAVSRQLDELEANALRQLLRKNTSFEDTQYYRGVLEAIKQVRNLSNEKDL